MGSWADEMDSMPLPGELYHNGEHVLCFGNILLTDRSGYVDGFTDLDMQAGQTTQNGPW